MHGIGRYEYEQACRYSGYKCRAIMWIYRIICVYTVQVSPDSPHSADASLKAGSGSVLSILRSKKRKNVDKIFLLFWFVFFIL